MQERTLVMVIEPLNQMLNVTTVLAGLTPREPVAKLTTIKEQRILDLQRLLYRLGRFFDLLVIVVILITIIIINIIIFTILL